MSYYSAELDAFDPNKGSESLPKWATFVPDRRSGNFKMHTKRGTAANALGTHDAGLLFEFVNSQWLLRVRKCDDDYDHTCTECKGPTAVFQQNSGRTLEQGRFMWERDMRGKLSDPLALMFVCGLCYSRLRR